jgi:hypothetical protein
MEGNMIVKHLTPILNVSDIQQSFSWFEKLGWKKGWDWGTYRELEVNLRIKPKKRLVRERPEPLAVPDAINEVWSMDFMHDQRGALLAWAERQGIHLEHIHPGKRQQNAYVERYNRTVRYAWLARTLFDSIEQV